MATTAQYSGHFLDHSLDQAEAESNKILLTSLALGDEHRHPKSDDQICM